MPEPAPTPSFWDKVKEKLVWIGGAIAAVLGAIFFIDSWRRKREADAADEARKVEDSASVAIGEIDKQTAEATKMLEASHAEEVKALEDRAKSEEARLRNDPAGLSRWLVDQGKRTKDPGSDDKGGG